MSAFDTPRMSLLMSDVGTRYQHLTELLEIWSEGEAILERKTWLSEHEKEMKQKLNHSVELLKKHMTGIASEYYEVGYSRVINALPKDAAEIKDEESNGKVNSSNGIAGDAGPQAGEGADQTRT